MTQPLARQLRNFRQAAIKLDLQILGWRVYSLTLVALLLFLLTEGIFFLSAGSRIMAYKVVFALFILVLLAALVITVMILFNWWPRYKPLAIAGKLGKLKFAKPDAVVNALQLEEQLAASTAPELSRAYIEQTGWELQKLEPKKVFPRRLARYWKLVTLGLQILVLVAMVAQPDFFGGALYRWSHPRREFPVPKPFNLVNYTRDVSILGGEDVTINIQSIGARPDSVYLELITAASADDTSRKLVTITKATTASEPGKYRFELKEIYRDFIYRAYVPATRFWQSWQEVSTENARITVTDRPNFRDFTITVIPPAYSKLETRSQQGNQADVQGLRGATIRIDLTANRNLGEGHIVVDDKPLPMQIRSRRATGDFKLNKNGNFLVRISDVRGITNRDPITYHLQIIPDQLPDMRVIEPPLIVELGDDQFVPIHLQLTDDFGFSDLQISYEVRNTSPIEIQPYTAIHTITELKPALLTQEVFSTWDLAHLDLFPGDEVHYHFEVYDNDDVSGPKKSLSGNFIARLPSLDDLFMALEEQETILSNELDLEADQLEAIREQLEQTRLELLKNDEMNWEQQKALEETLEKAQAQVEQLQKFAEALEQLSEQAEKHGLFSEDLLQKFNQLQELVEELITPELLQDMERLNEALENLDSREMLSALEQMSANMDQLEQQLDRFIDIFKRVQAEQKLEEVRKRLEQLAENQAKLDAELQRTSDQTNPSDMARLAFEEKRNTEEFQNIRSVMEEAAQTLEQFSTESAQDLEQLEESDLTEGTESALNQSSRELSHQQPQSARPHSRQARQNLEQLQSEFADLQQQFQEATTAEMARKFRSIMRDLLTISKEQERLQSTTAGLTRNSPRLGEAAGRQQMLQDQLRQTMSNLMDLSKETFAVTPEIGKAVGMSYAQMQGARQNLEERNSSQATNQQQAAMQALNEAALAVSQAMQNMQQSGSASGYEEFLQRMQQMSGQQQGINNQGMQLALGQMSAAAQQALMKRLAQEQGQVRKSLQELMNDMKQGSQQGLGDLSGIAQEMDEVLKDLQRQRYTRQTQERQQRILSRMLDSQKSMTQRDYKQKRKSDTAEQVVFSGPGGLPSDLGQRRSLIMEALNQALKSGYSADYQTMIRRYFDSISQEEVLEQK